MIQAALCVGSGRIMSQIEISMSETPKHNWGFRGGPGDEVRLPYNVEV